MFFAKVDKIFNKNNTDSVLVYLLLISTLHFSPGVYTEAATKCSIKKALLKILQGSVESNFTRASFLIKFYEVFNKLY